jgi:hypothetical protein
MILGAAGLRCGVSIIPGIEGMPGVEGPVPIGDGALQASPEVLTVTLGFAPLPGLE